MSPAVDNTSADQRRFDTLFEANHQDIYRYCVRRIGPFDAEDAAADVFAVAWRRITEMPPDPASRAWLFGVAYRVVGNRYRHRRRQSNLSQRLRLARPTDDTQPTDGVPGDEIDCLYRALDRLGATDRELLRLASWDGLRGQKSPRPSTSRKTPSISDCIAPASGCAPSTTSFDSPRVIPPQRRRPHERPDGNGRSRQGPLDR